jgi:hypothetical protein
MTPLRTPRLLLRQWHDSDLEPFAALNADPEVMRYFTAPLSREESDAFVDLMEAGFERDGWGLWAVELRATGDFIGFTGLARPSFDAHFMPAVEIGWRPRPRGLGQRLRLGGGPHRRPLRIRRRRPRRARVVHGRRERAVAGGDAPVGHDARSRRGLRASART